MSYDDEPTQELQALWATVVADGETMAAPATNEVWNFATTILPLRKPNARTDTIRATLKNLPTIGTAENLDDASDIWLRNKIGEGGMGMVYLGYQKTLDREIAVKTLKRTMNPENARREMLREAWITGRLEHPNIIPVHAMGLDANDLPIMLMKRVEGSEWLDIVEGNSPKPSVYADMDDLEMHLRILMQVCHAIHFAHQRGIIHRDLKLENVMLGEFGEVYVLDWGIALALEDDAGGRLPLARDADEIAGTPTYMAPEMTLGQGSGLGTHTDIYLLGAILHMVLTGEVRHKGRSLEAVLISAYASRPYDYDPDLVPEELANIANCAMAQLACDRFGSVEDFRQALAEFLQHRASHQLVTESGRRFGQLEPMLKRAKDLEHDELERVDRLFTEVRFGYEQALQIWSGNEQARHAFDVALLEMARFELGRRQATEALRWLAQMSRPEPEIQARAEALRAELDAERERLMTLERDRDVRVGSRGRASAAGLILVMWLVSGVIQSQVQANELGNLGFLIGDFVIAGGVIYAYREVMWRNKVNREIISLVMLMLGLSIINRVMMVTMMGMSYAQSVPAERLIVGMALATMGLHIDRRTLFAAIVFPIAAVLCAAFPGSVWWIVLISNNIVLVIIIAIWWRKPPEEALPGV